MSPTEPVHRIQIVNTAFRDPATMIAASIAVFALVVSVWQGCQMREHNRLSVRPSLDVTSDFSSSDGFIGFSIENRGAGLARVQGVWLEIDGRVIDHSVKNGWPVAISDLGLDKSVLSHRSYYAGDTIAAGKRLPYFGIFPKRVTPQARAELKSRISPLVIHICYCSIYDECEHYSVSYHGTPQRQRARSCTVPPPDATPLQKAAVH